MYYCNHIRSNINIQLNPPLTTVCQVHYLLLWHNMISFHHSKSDVTTFVTVHDIKKAIGKIFPIKRACQKLLCLSDNFFFCVNVNLTLYFVQLFIAKGEKELVDRKKFLLDCRTTKPNVTSANWGTGLNFSLYQTATLIVYLISYKLDITLCRDL